MTKFKYLPNLISISRGVAAIAILFTTAFSLPFWALYVWCGISDMIDGPLARRLGAESKSGAAIDSISDFVFVIAAAIKIIPALTLPSWLWWVIGAVALVQVLRMAYLYFRKGGAEGLHDKANKIIGVVLYLLPFLFLIR